MIQLKMFGGLRIEAPGLGPDSRVQRRHPLALIALVASSAPQPMSREKIMAFLWPESDTERASNSLRQTLFWIRKDLDENLFLPESNAGLQLDASKVDVDLWKFREGLDQGRPEIAARAYSGAFLDSFQLPDASDFTHWVETERDKLQRRYVEVLDALADTATNQGRHSDAVRLRRRQASIDPYSSRVALGLLRALAAAGDRPGALDYANVYENLVRTQLESDPDPSVLAYVEELRQQKFSPAESVAAAAATVLAPITSTASRRRWMTAAAAFAVVGFVAGRTLYTNDTTIVVASGTSSVGGRDPDIQLIECSGPACPDGALPQRAFVVPKHSSYATPADGTNYIDPVRDGTDPQSDKKKGYKCCTTAVFEQTFALPKKAVSATILISVLADNQASVSINGVEFGKQKDPWGVENYTGPPTLMSTTFVPDPSGINRLHVKLWDGAGALGLQYHGIVTYETKRDSL